MSSADTLTHTSPEAATEETAIAAAEHTHDHSHEQVQQAPPLNPECTRSVDVSIPAEEVSKAFRSIVRNYTKQARIPGFRPGKTPEKFIRSRFNDQIRQDVVEQLLPNHFKAAIDAQGAQPISQPQVTELELEDGQPLRFKALFEVLPELNLDGWNEIKIERENSELTDDELNAEIERARDSRSTMEPVTEERAIADGDWAEISFTGDVHAAEGEQAAEPITGQGVLLEIGGTNTLPAFTEALRGATVGQQLKFETTYPAEYPESRLANKTVAYDVELKGIKRKNAPELNDEFAKQLGEYESMDDFRTKVREHMSGNKSRQAEAATKDKVLEALADKYQFPIPESLVQQQIDARLDQGLRALAAQGMPMEQLRNLDFNRLRAAQRDQALGEVQGIMLLDKIAQLENVDVSDAELERELELYSVQSREPLETMRERFAGDGTLVRIREQIRREKTGALLYERLSA